MPLAPPLVARLTALQSLLDSGDIDLARAAATRLEGHRDEEPGVGQILDLLNTGRLSEAAGRIADVLSAGTRIAIWTDPEVLLLEKELEEISRELGETEAAQAELLHRMARFEAAQNEILGDRLQHLLELRLELKRLLALAANEAQQAEADSDFEQARKDWEEFSGSREEQRKRAAKTDWKLTDEEQQELKRIFREASKRCHPDVVAKEHHEAATELFRKLREAYESGDLLQVRHIADKARLGVFKDFGSLPGGSASETKENLRARIRTAREALEAARQGLEALRASPACQAMESTSDWKTFFEEQASQIEQQIQKLTQEIAKMTANPQGRGSRTVVG